MIPRFAIAAVALAASAAVVGPRPASAMIVEADAALLCPALEDFAAISKGAAVPGACVRASRDEDLYGPVGRAENLPGGPYVRVRREEALYWAQESAFFTPGGDSLPPSPVAPPANIN